MKGTKKEKDYDYLAKIVIIGNSSVGKTNLLLRFVTQEYVVSHTPTIGVDFKSKTIQIKAGPKNSKKMLKLQLWDTAGQERFRTLSETYYKGASGIIVVYAIDDRKSFTDVAEWLYQLGQYGADGLPRILVGNKCDLREQRKVKFQEGRLLADQNNCTFMEVSAKENINVQQVFLQLSRVIVNSLEEHFTQNVGKEPHKEPEQKRSKVFLCSPQPSNRGKECCS